jgi:hypothetical protein
MYIVQCTSWRIFPQSNEGKTVKNGPMAEKDNKTRNFDPAFEKSLQNIKCFHRSQQNIWIYLSRQQGSLEVKKP